MSNAQTPIQSSPIKSFLDGLKTPIKGLIEEIQGNAYLPWPTALALAGRPTNEVVTFGGQPYLSMLGGAVVAVKTGAQVMYLPVLDNRNQPIAQPNARDINDAINRARAKLIAVTHGIGMCLYSGETDPLKFIKDLGVKPDADLSTLQPLQSTKGGLSGPVYIDWATALCAAHIADADFRFEVVQHEVVDDSGEVRQLPYLNTGNGFMVAVTTVYRGREHTEWLPIMGVVEVQTAKGLKKVDHQALKNPTVFDWNRGVMRCLAKSIAINTGYGISIYAGEEVAQLHRLPAGAAPRPVSEADGWVREEAPDASKQAEAAPQAQPEAAAQAPAQAPAEPPQADASSSSSPAPAESPDAAPAPQAAQAAEPAAEPSAPAASQPQASAQPAAPAEPSVIDVQIAKLPTISDVAKIKRGIEAAATVFKGYPEEDINRFIQACKERQAALEQMKAAA